MTDSVPAERGKRERLVESARALMHEQGVQRTTLAEVAQRADVPAGNVYYYFKTKDELVGAVVDSYTRQARELLAGLERHRSPQARLKGLVRSWEEIGEAVARHGCPIGSLCAELGKRDAGLDGDASQVFALLIDWAGEQLRQLGRRDARELAVALIGGIQGAALLANTFRDPQLMASQARRLERWIDTLARPPI
jgi:TetR/AcrR family transcriptional regulator, transcriptional repressor for nem operon